MHVALRVFCYAESMARHPDRTVAVPIAELKAMLSEMERISTIFRDATNLDGNPEFLACYNYTSGSKAMESVSSFANAVASATMRFRSGKPFSPGELKPRSTAKKSSLEMAKEAKATAAKAFGKTTKKRKEPSE